MVSHAYFISQSTDFQHADNIISASCLNKERGVEGGNCPRGEKARGATVQGAIIQGEIDLGGNCPRGELSRGELVGGNCPGGIFRGGTDLIPATKYP